MTARRLSTLLIVALGGLAAGCGATTAGAPADTGPSSTATATTMAPTTTYGPISPPPAEVLDATVVYFDADGADEHMGRPELGVIDDESELQAFADRYVDEAPALGTAAGDALAAGDVLIGGVVSISCSQADGAILVLTAAGVDLLATGVEEDPEVRCVRAITSIALVAIDPADLPDAPVQPD